MRRVFRGHGDVGKHRRGGGVAERFDHPEGSLPGGGECVFATRGGEGGLGAAFLEQHGEALGGIGWIDGNAESSREKDC